MISRGRRRAPDGGFTLIEMMVVLVVLGLVGALVMTRGPVTTGGGAATRAAAQELARGLRLARARAMATNQAVVVTIDPSTRRFSVDGAPPRALAGVFEMEMASALESAHATRIDFAPDGGASGGIITLAREGQWIRVTVGVLTGRVAVDEGQ